jgi:hypothetical protein
MRNLRGITSYGQGIHERNGILLCDQLMDADSDWQDQNSVAELVHFCAVPSPACQKFRLQLGPFFPYKKEKFMDFHDISKKFHVF